MLNASVTIGPFRASLSELVTKRFAWDSYRRLFRMFSGIVMGVSGQLLRIQLLLRRPRRALSDTELDL